MAGHHELSIRLACRKRKLLSVAPRTEEGDFLPRQAQVEAPVVVAAAVVVVVVVAAAVVAQCGAARVFQNTVRIDNSGIADQKIGGRTDEQGCIHFDWGFLRPVPDFAFKTGSRRRSKFKF